MQTRNTIYSSSIKLNILFFASLFLLNSCLVTGGGALWLSTSSPRRDHRPCRLINSRNSYVSFSLPENKTLYNIELFYLQKENATQVKWTEDTCFLNPAGEYMYENYYTNRKIPQKIDKEYLDLIKTERVFPGGCEYFFPSEIGWGYYNAKISFDGSFAAYSERITNVYIPQNYTLRFTLLSNSSELKSEIVPTKTNFGECNLE